jgi:hypothetical protein
MQYSVCYARGNCSLSYCRKQRTRYIYGLVDPRMWDVFYVGSAFDALKRFTEHIRDEDTSKLKAAWIQDILNSGSYPLPILLCEFQTVCDNYSRKTEYQIADTLRDKGYTALSDDTIFAHVDRMQEKCGIWEALSFDQVVSIFENSCMEMIDRIHAHATTVKILAAMYHAS